MTYRRAPVGVPEMGKIPVAVLQQLIIKIVCWLTIIESERPSQLWNQQGDDREMTALIDCRAARKEPRHGRVCSRSFKISKFELEAHGHQLQELVQVRGSSGYWYGNLNDSEYERMYTFVTFHTNILPHSCPSLK